MDRLRFYILTSMIHGCSTLLDSIFRSLRAGQLHDQQMRTAILADLHMIAGKLTEIAAELERDYPQEEQP